MPDDEGLRLSEALTMALCGPLAADGWVNERQRTRKTWEHADRVKRLLPVVEQYAAVRVAEALRAVEAVLSEAHERARLGIPFPNLIERLAAALATDGTEPRPAHRQDEPRLVPPARHCQTPPVPCRGSATPTLGETRS